jgi:hypothetical protein
MGGNAICYSGAAGESSTAGASTGVSTGSATGAACSTSSMGVERVATILMLRLAVSVARASAT